MINLRSGLLLLLCITLTSCGEWPWPPQRSIARSHLREHQASFDEIAAKLRASGFWRASYSLNDSIRVEPSEHNPYLHHFVNDDPQWAALFKATNMQVAVLFSDGSVGVSTGASLERDQENRTTRFVFLHTLDGDITPCRPEYKTLDCGSCEVHLQNDWYISYDWMPREIDITAYAISPSVSPLSDLYTDATIVALEQCVIDGLKATGQDVESIINSMGP